LVHQGFTNHRGKEIELKTKPGTEFACEAFKNHSREYVPCAERDAAMRATMRQERFDAAYGELRRVKRRLEQDGEHVREAPLRRGWAWDKVGEDREGRAARYFRGLDAKDKGRITQARASTLAKLMLNIRGNTKDVRRYRMKHPEQRLTPAEAIDEAINKTWRSKVMDRTVTFGEFRVLFEHAYRYIDANLPSDDMDIGVFKRRHSRMPSKRGAALAGAGGHLGSVLSRIREGGEGGGERKEEGGGGVGDSGGDDDGESGGSGDWGAGGSDESGCNWNSDSDSDFNDYGGNGGDGEDGSEDGAVNGGEGGGRGEVGEGRKAHRGKKKGGGVEGKERRRGGGRGGKDDDMGDGDGSVDGDDVDVLGAEWGKAYDAKSDKVYYFNARTLETRWDAPEEEEERRGEGGDADGEEGAAKGVGGGDGGGRTIEGKGE
jgi:hypothetical protein